MNFPTPLEREARAVAREAAPWVEAVARFGHVAKAVVYALVAMLAVRAALGHGHTPDKTGALHAVDRTPFGDAILAVLTVGFAAFALWRGIQAVFDPDHHGHSAAGIALRLREAVSGAGYATLAMTSWELFTDQHVKSGEAESRELTARVLGAPGGEWLVGAAGGGLVAYGVYELYRAVTARFLEKMDLGSLSRARRAAVTWLGRIGVAAHGAVLGLTGAFLVRAAIEQHPHHARGLGGALRALASSAAGPMVLLVVAFGLLAYAALVLLEVRYRRMKLAPQPSG